MPFNHAVVFCFIYIFGSIFTAYLMQSNILDYPFYVNRSPGSQEFVYIYFQVAVFSATLLIGRILLKKKQIPHEVEPRKSVSNSSSRSKFIFPFLVLLVVSLTVFHWDEMTADSAARHSGNQTVARLTLVSVLVGAIILRNERYITRLIGFLLLIYIGTLDGAIGASRGTAVPFIVVSLSFFLKKNYITGFIFSCLGFIALRTAFSARGDPSYFNFWSIFLEFLTSLDFVDSILAIIQLSFPGLSTVQVSMSNPGEFSVIGSMKFLLYVSPLPSSILPASLFDGSSLSGTIGIDRSALGINQDIYSEGIYWFGSGYAWIYTMVLGLLVLMPYFVANNYFRFIGYSIYLACFLVNIWMVVGGQVFTLRAGSRAVFALVILMIIYSVLKRLRWRAKRPN